VISEIHQKLDAVYVFGIGSKIDIEELKLMASKVCSAFLFEHISWFLALNYLNRNLKPEYIRTFESFDDIQNAIEYFVLMQGTVWNLIMYNSVYRENIRIKLFERWM